MISPAMPDYRLLALAVAACVGWVSCGSGTSPGPMPSSAALSSRSVDARIFEYVNLSRVSGGGRAVERDAFLDKLALEHAQASMRKGRGAALGHDGFQSRFQAAHQGVGAVMFAENVHRVPASSADPARRVVEEWAASPVHRKNQYGSWNRTGVGVVRDSEGWLWAVQVFASVPSRSAP